MLDESTGRRNHARHYNTYMHNPRESKQFHVGERDFEVTLPASLNHGNNARNFLRDSFASIDIPPDVTVTDITDKTEIEAVSVVLQQAIAFRPVKTTKVGSIHTLDFARWNTTFRYDRRRRVLSFCSKGQEILVTPKSAPVYAALMACQAAHFGDELKCGEKTLAKSTILWLAVLLSLTAAIITINLLTK